MPKLVDHEERRAELAAAVWRIASREGVEALTIRGVAAEAGWSTGALVHYFRDKEELLLFAFESVADRAGRRMLAAAGRIDDPDELLRAQLVEGLPLDAERRAEVRVWFAFLGLSGTRPALAEAGRRAYRLWRARIAETLGTLPGRAVDAEAEAATLVALVDGIAVQASFEPRAFPAARQLAMVDARLAGLGRP